jgi:class 3 adenylate cyclase/TolB-like protein/tetratricopeptide (TPR) repeat protein
LQVAELKWVQRTIVVADLVESVRLMQGNAADVIQRWQAFERHGVNQVLPAHQGRVVRSMGDGMLLEFTSVPSAVACAIELREAIELQNRGRAEPECLWLRLGVHLGDVVQGDLDIYGHAVNVAARLAASAGPREIVASVDVRDRIVAGLHADVEDLGDLFLKHLDAPVRAFRLHAPGAARRGTVSPAERGGLKPSIAVVPFRPSTPDPAFHAIGHALADDINAALSRTHDLRVISRLSTAGFGGAAHPVSELRAHLGAIYVLSGAYHVIGERVRVTVELCDAREDRVIWATGLTTTINGIFLSQDELVPQIVGEVGRRVLEAELDRTGRLPVPSLEGYSLYLGGVGLLHRLSSGEFNRSRELLQQVAERQPRAAAPHAMLAKWHILRLVQGWSGDPHQEAGMARAEARKAMALDAGEAFALTADGLVSVLVDGDLDAGAERYARAIESNPQEPYAWALMAGLHTYREAPAAAEDAARRALQLSPLDPARFLFEAYLAFAKLGADKYDEAADWARSSLRLNGAHAASHRLLVMALSMGGQREPARQAAARLLATDPRCTVKSYLERYPAKTSARRELYAQALLDAGVPA